MHKIGLFCFRKWGGGELLLLFQSSSHSSPSLLFEFSGGCHFPRSVEEAFILRYTCGFGLTCAPSSFPPGSASLMCLPRSVKENKQDNSHRIGLSSFALAVLSLHPSECIRTRVFLNSVCPTAGSLLIQ